MKNLMQEDYQPQITIFVAKVIIGEQSHLMICDCA